MLKLSFPATNAGYKGILSQRFRHMDNSQKHEGHITVIRLFWITTEVNQQKLFVFWWEHKTIHCSFRLDDYYVKKETKRYII